MAKESLKFADIVLVHISDENGENLKSRPCMVAEVYNDGSVLVIAITSTFDPNKLKPTQIDGIPWKSNLPRAATGLSKPSVIDCSWYCTADSNHCKKIGMMPALLAARAKMLLQQELEKRSSEL